MLRLLKFISVFLGVTLVIFFLVFGLNRTAFQTLFDNRHAIAEGSEWVEKTYSLRGLTEYIGEHPDRVSIASIPLERPDEAIYYREQTPRAMGLTGGVLILAAYADAFDRDLIDPGEPVSWDDVERFQLPMTGGPQLRDARRTAVEEEATGEEGQISIADLVSLLPRFSSPAIHDFLLDHLGLNRMDNLLDRLNLPRTERPVPLSGILLTLSPTIQDIDAGTVLDYWSEQDRTLFQEEGWANSNAFAWGDRREEWLTILERENLGHDYFQQRDLLRLFPQTTAEDMTGLLHAVVEDRLINSPVSGQIRDWLRRTGQDATLRRHFSDFGGLYDTRMGLLGGIDYGITAEDGATHIQAVYFDTIQIAVWFHISSNHMNQDYQRRLMWDPHLRNATRSAIEQHQL